MADRDHPDDIIKNEATRSRRAWVDRARQAVRRRLEAGEAMPEAAEPQLPPRPRLHVVPSGGKR